MSPLRGTCPEPPSPWGRLAFPRLSPLTPGSRKVPGTPVLRPARCEAATSPSVAGAVRSASAPHLLPCPLGTQGPEGEGGAHTAKRGASVRAQRRTQAPDPGARAGSGSVPAWTRLLPSADATSCRESGEYWALRSVPSECGHRSGGPVPRPAWWEGDPVSCGNEELI